MKEYRFLANILANVLVDLTPVIIEQMKPGGIYITSGIIQEKEETVRSVPTAFLAPYINAMIERIPLPEPTSRSTVSGETMMGMIRTAAGILALFWMCVIFAFSAQGEEESIAVPHCLSKHP